MRLCFYVQTKRAAKSIPVWPSLSVSSFILSFVLPFFVYLLLSISVSLQQSLAEVQHLRAKALASPTQEATGFLLKDSSGGGGSSKNSSSCDTDDFVMVPAHFNSKKTFFFFHWIRTFSKCQMQLCIVLALAPALYNDCLPRLCSLCFSFI